MVSFYYSFNSSAIEGNLMSIEPRKAMLYHTAELVTGDRNATYGSPTQNFTDTAAFWTLQLKHKLKDDAQIDASDVAKLMISLKLCRMIAASKDDNWIDIAGYAGCGYEAEGYGTVQVPDVLNAGDPEPPRDTTWRDANGDLWKFLEEGTKDQAWYWSGDDGVNWYWGGAWCDSDDADFPWERVL